MLKVGVSVRKDLANSIRSDTEPTPTEVSAAGVLDAGQETARAKEGAVHEVLMGLEGDTTMGENCLTCGEAAARLEEIKRFLGMSDALRFWPGGGEIRWPVGTAVAATSVGDNEAAEAPALTPPSNSLRRDEGPCAAWVSVAEDDE